jgi:hypothetical protein
MKYFFVILSMGTVINKRTTKEQFEKLLLQSKPKPRPLKFSFYKGKFSWKGNALKIQQSMRDE